MQAPGAPTGATESMSLEVGSATDPGRVRPKNEDYIRYEIPADALLRGSRGSLFVVADGVGAGDAGVHGAQTDPGERGGPETDVYPLGLIFYELLSRPAFRSANPSQHDVRAPEHGCGTARRDAADLTVLSRPDPPLGTPLRRSLLRHPLVVLGLVALGTAALVLTAELLLHH